MARMHCDARHMTIGLPFKELGFFKYIYYIKKYVFAKSLLKLHQNNFKTCSLRIIQFNVLFLNTWLTVQNIAWCSLDKDVI